MKPYVKKFWETVVPPSAWKMLLRTARQLVPADYNMQHGLPSMAWSVENLKKLGYHPATIIDVGAYRGDWTKEVQPIFPKANFLMVEPQPERAATLESLTKKLPNVYFASALAGASDDAETAFNVLKTGSSVYAQRYKAEELTPKTITLPVQTLDTLVKKNALPGDYFIKLDVQGYEPEVLKGATEVLKDTEVVLLEANLLNYLYDAPLLADVVTFMAERHYLPFDICELYRKNDDGVLAFVDMMFIKENSPIRTRANYQSVRQAQI